MGATISAILLTLRRALHRLGSQSAELPRPSGASGDILRAPYREGADIVGPETGSMIDLTCRDVVGT